MLPVLHYHLEKQKSEIDPERHLEPHFYEQGKSRERVHEYAGFGDLHDQDCMYPCARVLSAPDIYVQKLLRVHAYGLGRDDQ